MILTSPTLSCFSRRHCLHFLAISFTILLSACSASAGPDISGTWYFATGQTGGSTTAVYGTLKLEPSGSYEDSHRIAGILTYSKGTYTVNGDTLSLVPEAGKGKPMTYTFTLGQHQDKEGKPFTGLTLKGASDLTFLLTKEKKK
ncbi:hypothetical protein DES53_11954 [Roseimicrobium gellanilyticum]|uniref:Lipocalin-like protein n=1 Tax=Roseimicrobium gellanilyticum TaxID=748857 RepID=A0A366H3L4_9BACT|nr:hypothetical protein [Roseimicrobium gellanilyticum]RBP35888.1 hypothetical protein DES53_11954 [Roseimicrobium gellanilyticum]